MLMKDPKATSQSAWNKGQIVGQKRPFSLDDIFQIERFLQETQNWHDLALLSFGLDTMLRASDLLTTQVWHVQYANGSIRRVVPRRQRKTGMGVNPVLTHYTRQYLQQWITLSGKRKEDFLFTRTKPNDGFPIRRSHFAEIIKSWAIRLHYDPSEFSTHSLRRSKAAHMYWEEEDIALISRLLGHKSLASTIEYLGITQAKAEQASLRHSLMQGMDMSYLSLEKSVKKV